MPDKRLIDANALLETHRRRLVQNTIKVENGAMTKPYSNFEAAIMACLAEYLSSAPTIDAVEVVRCKDCKYAFVNHNHISDPLICCKTKMVGTTDPDWFCAAGERKMDGGEPHEENPHTL